jgi:KaiC protein
MRAAFDDGLERMSVDCCRRQFESLLQSLLNGSEPDSRMTPSVLPQAPAGITGLDQLMGGGLIEGVPGTGKTTPALQFLLAAKDRGERTRCVTLSKRPRSSQTSPGRMGGHSTD